MKITIGQNLFQLQSKRGMILEHTKENPMIFIGCGKESVDMYRGNYKIDDYVSKRYPVELTEVEERKDSIFLNFEEKIKIEVKQNQEKVELHFEYSELEENRFWIRIAADEQEKCYGCGEQMSYFNLRGRNFPIWTSEPGVGRDKTTYVTWRSDVENKGGGDYYNTNYPQPTYVSTKMYYLHIDSTAYCDFDFKNTEYHELQVWEMPKMIRIEEASKYVELVEKITNYFGRQEELPDWIYNGVILGLQGGIERSLELLNSSIEHGIKVSGLWCQDWVGKRVTSFGKRLQWDWMYHKEMYPNLPDEIARLKDNNIRFLGYINPYLVNDGVLYREAKEKNYFATKHDGSDYLVDFGEFDCGVIDFTNPDAFEWFKNVIKEHMIGIGMDGWMADFGEYLPTDDMQLYNKVSPMIEHNHWPALWAKCNYDAVKETETLGEIVYFMRAGGAGIQKHCTLLWAGDQSVDFSRHDGLITVISAALSAGMMGCGLSHSDIGGYTSLFDNTRTKELFLRWAEMAVFTPVMRTHEGNRPDTNFQYYDDKDTMVQFARLTDVYTMLSPYIKELVKINSRKGIPVQRPLFMHYEEDLNTYDIQDEYLFGEDMVIAPVVEEGKVERMVYLPDATWIHLWTLKEYKKGEYNIQAPMGYPPVFYKKDSAYKSLFEQIFEKYGEK